MICLSWCLILLRKFLWVLLVVGLWLNDRYLNLLLRIVWWIFIWCVLVSFVIVCLVLVSLVLVRLGWLLICLKV